MACCTRSTPAPGKEKWAFLIEEALPQIAAQMSDIVGPEINIADGSLAVYQSDDNGDGIVNGADKVWLYFGLRRGGRAYYALDVTDSAAPQFKWKITANSGLGTGMQRNRRLRRECSLQ